MNGDPAPQLTHPARLAVRFTKPHNSYRQGDVATFPADAARALVARRVARPVNLAPQPGADGRQRLRQPGGMVTKA